MPEVILQDVAKHYGSSVAVENMSMHISPGELVALLGPSGCGKTTTLRMIGGFVDITSGRISVGGRDVTALPPNRRNMGFVFQNYALFPHMTVAENVAFGLEMRKLSKSDISGKVAQALARVRLSSFADRLPKQLSGGQQQRVALARALVIEPDVLLLDEPLSNLDATLRQEMKIEIRQLQQSLGLTTIFVTHDQDEAMSTADRMVLMRQGRVEQVGAPDEIYDQPASRFAAEFMGIPNLLPGRMNGPGRFELEDGTTVHLDGQKRYHGSCVLALRPESIGIGKDAPAGAFNSLPGTVEIVTYHGASLEYRVRLGTSTFLTARTAAPGLGGPDAIPIGTEVRLFWPYASGVLVPEV
ncbi:ABC transporter ATP-binding protein [Rhizobium sp. TRM96647]|uniref:ABC transporter ATP-binding protein n=1 Tax=unclassified Rhizobium TaxID=2613769 RepID=UPI0021E7A5F8|nr:MULTISPECIES: ABC transporter ATP-binding protein [unclassified Rhizobium]MCV3737345.1 ABC transporter ATP-binding protein [Rhizobium sp. TRM96647]MCV3759329.1 ABC transporter ATP-binding protein [Rhizobium sp. TRM96650]